MNLYRNNFHHPKRLKECVLHWVFIKIWLLVLAVSFALCPAQASSTPTDSLTQVPFSVIHSPDVNDYEEYQLMLIYVGDQTMIVPTLGVIGSNLPQFDGSLFVPFYSDSISYFNDIFVPDTLVLSAEILKTFLDSISMYPELQTHINTSPDSVLVSLMVLRGSAGSAECWEHLASYEEALQLYDLFHSAVTPSLRFIRSTILIYRGRMLGE